MEGGVSTWYTGNVGSRKNCVVNSGGSRISPRRGLQLPRGAPTYDLAKFSQKLHEIERIWARPSRPP